MFLQNGFLVDLAYEKIGKVLKLDSISTGNEWKGDTLIFNTYHWWTHTGRSKTYISIYKVSLSRGAVKTSHFNFD